jgi:hypothetical protein
VEINLNIPFSLNTYVWTVAAFAVVALSKESLGIRHRRLGHISEKVVFIMAGNKWVDNLNIIQSQSSGSIGENC